MPRFLSSLRARLSLIILAAFLPALALVIYKSREQQKLARQITEHNILMLAEDVYKNYETIIDGAHQLLTGLALLPAMRNLDSQACSGMLADILDEFPIYLNLGAAKPNGDIFCSATQVKSPVNLSDQPYFQEALRTRDLILSDYLTGGITSKPNITLAHASVTNGGKVETVFLAALSLSWLNKILPVSKLPPGSLLTLHDTNGTILARYPDGEKSVGKLEPDPPAIKLGLAESGRGLAEAVDLDGVSRIYAFARVRGASPAKYAYVSVSIPEKTAFAELRRAFYGDLSLLGLLVLLSVAATSLASHHFISRPANILAEATKRVAAGDLGVRTGLAHGDGELHQLAYSFDQMADSLEQYIAERKRAEEQTQRHLAELSALRAIDHAATSTLNLQTVLNALLEKIDLVLPYAASTVRLLNSETGYLEPIACRNLDREQWKSRLPAAHTRNDTAVQTSSPVITRNLQTDPQTRDPTFFREQGLVSCMRIPLITKDKVLGTIAFYTRREHEFSAEETESLTSLANQAAIAIYNAQLYEQSQANQLRASALYEVAATVNQSLDLDEILHRVIKKISEIFGFEAIRVLLLDPQGEELRLKVEHNRVPLTYAPPTTFRRGRGILGTIAETGEAMIFDDLQNDARYAELSQSKASQKAGLSFFAGFPIKSKTRTVGVLLCVGQSPRRLTSDEVSLINSMTHQIGTAAENIRLYDAAREQALALERSNKIKDEFLSVMSHELRTPLNVVVGYSGMLKDGLLGELNPRQQEALAKIINRAGDQLAMVNNILFATVLEGEEAVKVETHEMDLPALMEQLKSAYEAPINKDVVLRWNYSTDFPAIETDSGKLGQILRNLIENAIKFTDKGSITISAAVVSASPVPRVSASGGEDSGTRGEGDTERWVEFKVADTGVGIPQEALPYIFDKFRQVDSSETRRFGGAGLGLYIVKKFTELLGGIVEVESEVGKGSTFTVKLPLER